MTAEYAESFAHPAIVPDTPRLTVVEAKLQTPIMSPNPMFAEFSERPGVAGLAAALQAGRYNVAPSFNASLLDFVRERAPAFRNRPPFGTPDQAQTPIARTSREYLSAWYHEAKQKGNDAERERFRASELEQYGRIAIQHYAEYAEIGITNRIASGYRLEGKTEVVRTIGDVMIVFGKVIHALELQSEGLPARPMPVE